MSKTIIDDWCKVPSLAALKEIYFDEFLTISASLGVAIVDDNTKTLTELLNKYFFDEEAKHLLSSEIAIQKVDGDEITFSAPLFLALKLGSINAFSVLLDYVKTPNARLRDSSGYTLLMVTSIVGDIESAKALINAGADINLTTNNDHGKEVNALTLAIANGFYKLANFFLDQAATPKFVDAILAIGNKNQILLERLVLLNHNFINEHGTEDNRTLLHHAAGHGNLDAIQYLIGIGAEINSTDSSNLTPFNYAISSNNQTAALYLKELGALAININEDASTVQVKEQFKNEITNKVERLELMEEKFGISIDGLYVTCEKIEYGNYQYVINATFDVSGTGVEIQESLSIRLNAYNETGQLLGIGKAFINEDFMGFDSKDITLHVDQEPARLRLYPGPY